MRRLLHLPLVLLCFAIFAAASFTQAANDGPGRPSGLPRGIMVPPNFKPLTPLNPWLGLVFEDDFKKGADRWEPSDAKVWKVIDTKDGKAYSLFDNKTEFKPPHRSPFLYSLVKDLTVGDCILDVDCKSTINDYPHRDLCFVFGYQDKDHFYYAHLGKKTDDHCNQIFIVNGADRTKISTKTTDGTPWTDDWHHVMVGRIVENGTIAVYFDGMMTPIMTATDKTFTWGRVGVGSFDDTGDFRAVKVYGVKVEKK